MSTTSGRAKSRVELVPPPLPTTTDSSVAQRQSSLHSIMQAVNKKSNSGRLGWTMPASSGGHRGVCVEFEDEVRGPPGGPAPRTSSPTPGRENWRLQEDRILDRIWPNHWGLYNDHPERDSLNEGAEGGGGGGGVEGGGGNCPVEGNRGVSSPGASPTRDHDSPSAANLEELGPCGRRHRRNLLGILTNSGHSHRKINMGLQDPHLMHHHKRNSSEPFTYVWISLSSLYGRLVVILMLAFCLVEVMDNHIKLLSLQGVFLMYLYVGSIAVIMCIYIWVLIDSCASLQSSDGSQPPTLTTSIVADAELAGGMPHGGDPPSISRFGSLKRAHISRSRTAYTSFYLRLGALAFGLGTLVFNGLEMAMHSMMEGSCLNDVVFVHPVLHGLFTFLQMHFLFVNSQVLVERFGVAARFGFMHLAATNLALWIRLIIWESGNEWTYFVYLAQTGLQGTPHTVHGPSAALAREIPTPLQLRGFPRSMTMARAARDITFGVNLSAPARVYMPVSDNHIGQVVALHECLNTNSLGQLWTSSMPFLYPFIVQFSLIAAAVTFVMGKNVGRSGSLSGMSRSLSVGKSTTSSSSTFTVDCSGASKGLFLGLLCLVAGIVVIIIFLVVKEDEDIPSDTIFWLTFGALGSVLAICLIMTLIGLIRVRQLSVIGRRPTPLDKLLSGVTLSGVVLYSLFGVVVGASGVWRGGVGARRHAMLLCVSAMQLVQSATQSALIGEASRRAALTRHQLLTRPSRQVITFLLFANAVLWAYDTFVVQSWVSQEMQLRFFGVLAWGVISRVGLPLLVFYRFHSCVLLLEVWKCSYRTGLSGN